MAETHNPYPTSYSNYSDAAVYGLFRSENWYNLTPDERANALQELANRSARDNHTQAAKVSVEPMEGGAIGFFRQTDGQLHINSNVVNAGVLRYRYTDENGVERQGEQPLPAANLRAMTNIYHEDWHHAQHASKDNPNIYGDDVQAQKNAQANIQNYISPGTDRDLYRIQQLEKEANEHAYQKTLDAMNATEQDYGGREASLEDYEGSIPESYQAALAAAQKNYNDPNIEDTMKAAMNDSYYGNGYISKHQTDSYYRVRNTLIDQKIARLEAAQKQSAHPEQYQAAIVAAQHSKSMIAAEQKAAAAYRNTHQADTGATGISSLQQPTGISGMKAGNASSNYAPGIRAGNGASGAAFSNDASGIHTGTGTTGVASSGSASGIHTGTGSSGVASSGSASGGGMKDSGGGGNMNGPDGGGMSGPDSGGGGNHGASNGI